MQYYKYPLQLDQEGKPLLVSQEQNIKDCLQLLLLESMEERKILVDFGSPIHDYVFELPHEINQSLLEREILEKIWHFEQRIYDIEIDTSFREETLWIDIEYKVKENKEKQQMQMKFNMK